MKHIDIINHIFQDSRAQMTLPLPGFQVTLYTCNEHKHAFKFFQARKNYYLAADTQDQRERWMYAFKEGSRGEDLTRENVYSLGKASQDPPSSSEYITSRNNSIISNSSDAT